MKTISEDELIDLVIEWVKENNITGGLSLPEISANTNLLESGLLDSFAFIELLLFIENYSGTKIDLIDVNPEDFTVIRNLCRLALGNNLPDQVHAVDDEPDPVNIFRSRSEV